MKFGYERKTLLVIANYFELCVWIILSYIFYYILISDKVLKFEQID